jgi:hypothetical protein
MAYLLGVSRPPTVALLLLLLLLLLCVSAWPRLSNLFD